MMASTDSRQGAKNEFDFRYITTKSEGKIVLAHLEQNFYLDEPVNKILGTSEDRVADQHQRYTDMLNQYHKSIYVTHSTDLEHNHVAGVLIIHIHDRNNPLPVFKPKSPITSTFLHFLEYAESKYNVFEKHGLSAFPELAILSIDKKYRGKGFATELYQRAIEQLFSEGFPLIYTEFSNPISRKIGQKLGFKEVARVYFNECKGTDGSDLFHDVNEEEFVSLMILENESKCKE